MKRFRKAVLGEGIPPIHGRRATILAGHGVSITAEALRWTSQEGAFKITVQSATPARPIDPVSDRTLVRKAAAV